MDSVAENKAAYVFDIQKFSVHDGPGIRTIVFLKGCPMSCQWCANPESLMPFPELMYYPDKCIGCGKCVETCPQDAIECIDGMYLFDQSKCDNCGACAETCYANARKMTGKLMTVQEVIKEVDKDMTFYRNSGGGITFSGGEALTQPAFVKETAKYYKEQGISVAVETCGYVPWENFEAVAEYLDLVLFDVKMMDDEKHKQYCGRSNELIFSNLEKISGLVETIIRMPIIPGINDSKEDIDAIGARLKKIQVKTKKIHILPYHNFGVGKYNALNKPYLMENVQAPSDEHMEEIKQQLEDYGFEVIIGG